MSRRGRHGGGGEDGIIILLMDDVLGCGCVGVGIMQVTSLIKNEAGDVTGAKVGTS